MGLREWRVPSTGHLVATDSVSSKQGKSYVPQQNNARPALIGRRSDDLTINDVSPDNRRQRIASPYKRVYVRTHGIQIGQCQSQ